MQAFPVIRARLSTSIKAPNATCTRRLFSVSVSTFSREAQPSRSRPISPNSSISLPRADPEGFVRKSKFQRLPNPISGSSPSSEVEAPAVETGSANQQTWEWKPQAAEGSDSGSDKVALRESTIDSINSASEGIDIVGDSVVKARFVHDNQGLVRRHFGHGRPLPAQRPSAETTRPKFSFRQVDPTEINIGISETYTDANFELEGEPDQDSSRVRSVFAHGKFHPVIRRTSEGGREVIRVRNDEASIQRELEERDAMAVNSKRIANPVLFICDVQEKFRNAIYEFEKVITTSQKMVKAAKILNIPIFVTTQNAARLGNTVEEITSLLPENTAQSIDKTAFSMLVPALQDQLTNLPSSSSGKLSVFLVGIETHICVTQTTLDLLAGGHKVYVLADGVSSCNAAERPIALNRLAREGAIVTTSESLLFELLGDAKDENFKAVSGLVRETKETTKEAVEIFCRL